MRFLSFASLLVLAPADDYGTSAPPPNPDNPQPGLVPSTALPVDAPHDAALPSHITAGYPAPNPAAGPDELRVPDQIPPPSGPPDAPAPISSPAPSVVQPATLAHVDKSAAEVKAIVVASHESILQHIEDGFKKLGEIVERGGKIAEDVVIDLPKVVADTPQVRAAISGIVADALVVFKDIEAEYTDATALNFPALITLAPTTIAAFTKLVADVKAGNAVVIADLKALGVPLP